MEQCEVCGNKYDKPITVTRDGKTHVFDSFECAIHMLAPTCEHCGFRTHLGGPMWGGPLHNPAFIQRMLDLLPELDPAIYGTIPRIEGMLTTARDEMLLPRTDGSPAEHSTDAVSNGTDADTTDSKDAATGLIPRLPPQDNRHNAKQNHSINMLLT